MNSKQMMIKIFLIVAAVSMPWSVQAFQDDGDDGRATKKRETKSASRRSAKGQEGQQAKLKKLELAMKKSLDLDRQQMESTQRYFQRYFSQRLRRTDARYRSHSSNRTRAGVSRKSVQQSGRMLDAKAARRKNTTKKQTQKDRMGKGHVTMLQLLDQLEGELKADQKKSFVSLLKKLDIDRPTPEKDIPLKELRSAVRTASLRLSNDQRATVTSLLRDGMAAESQSLRFGDDNRAEEIANETREAVFGVLTTSQAYKLKEAIRLRATRPRVSQSDASENEPEEAHSDEGVEDDGDQP